MQEHDEPPEQITPEDFLPANPFPPDAQRMGIDRWTGDGGCLIAVAASLNPAKMSHRIVAWVMLLVVTVPLITLFWQELQ
jgi:hypothetical protein